MIQSRRKFIGSLISLVAAPAIVKYDILMPVKTFDPTLTFKEYEDQILAPMVKWVVTRIMEGSQPTYPNVFEGLITYEAERIGVTDISVRNVFSDKLDADKLTVKLTNGFIKVGDVITTRNIHNWSE